MGQISLTLPSDGTTIEAADVNNPFNTILNEFNGNIDDNNIKSGANINGTKLLANSIPPTAFDTNSRAGWLNGILAVPNTVTAIGNRIYQLVFNTTDLTSVLSVGQKIRTTRTVAAPNQCTSLNGSTQFWNKTSPAGMTFTNNFVASAWIKPSTYNGAQQTILSRYNGTSGFEFKLDTTGQVILEGYNAGAANFSLVESYQSIPLNKWVHVAAQLDMLTFTATPTTSYVMIDGVDVAAAVSRGGTNPTALVQAGNLEIGSTNAGTKPFTGKIAQAAIFNSKVTEATMLTYISQGFAGTETSLISAYSFSNSSNDLNGTNANNLSANGVAVATNADSPFGGQANGTISTTLDYAEILDVTFSTNTTVTVRATDVGTIPNSGGVTAIAYSPQDSPFGWPGRIINLIHIPIQTNQTGVTAEVDGLGYLATITVPTGRRIKITAHLQTDASATDSYTSASIKEGSAYIQTKANNTATAGYKVIILEWEGYVTSGSHTYKISFQRGGGTGTVSLIGGVAAANTPGQNFLKIDIA